MKAWSRVLLGAALIVGEFVLLPGCASPTPIQRAGADQNATVAILWKFREDPRLAHVQVDCANLVVTLRGRVDDLEAEDAALRLASYSAPRATIVSALEIRPR